MITQFVLTFLAAFLFGYERAKSHKPTGFPTFIFVAVGSCAFAMIAVAPRFNNALFLISGVITSIGFLGAGSLIKNNDKIFGFTTASSIWLFAIFGVLMGLEEYIIALIVYILIWLTMAFDYYLQKKGVGSYRMKIMITCNKIVSEAEIKNVLLINTKSYKLVDIDVNKKDKKMVLSYFIEGNKDNINKLPKALYDKEWFDSCKIEW